MPSAEYRNPVVREAIKRALRLRGLSYRDAAELLGVKYETAKDFIGIGVFSKNKAAKWSAALGIPLEVFTKGVIIDGVEPFDHLGYQDLVKEIMSLKGELAELKIIVEELQSWKDRVCGKE